MLVVKCGGAAGVDYRAICADAAYLIREGERIVLVHGGSAEANSLGEQLGTPPRFLTSTTGVRSRYTDAATLDVITLAMAGRVNPAIVAQMLSHGIQAIGLSGIDGGLIQAQRKAAIKAVFDGKLQVIRDDLTGKIQWVNAQLLHTLLGAGYTPVISPPAIDPESGPVNVDADRTAAAVAAALGASHLIILSNVPGLLRDPEDPTSLIPHVSMRDFDMYMEMARGRMKLKMIATREALAGGVSCVTLADGRGEHPIRAALDGRGTVVE